MLCRGIYQSTHNQCLARLATLHLIIQIWFVPSFFFCLKHCLFFLSFFLTTWSYLTSPNSDTWTLTPNPRGVEKQTSWTQSRTKGFLTIQPDRKLKRSGKNKWGGLAVPANKWRCCCCEILPLLPGNCAVSMSWQSSGRHKATSDSLQGWQQRQHPRRLFENTWMILNMTFNFCFGRN